MSMTLISTVTVGGTPSTIQFTSIPQTYTDLLMVISVRSTHTAPVPIQMSINSVFSGSSRWLGFDNTTLASSSSSNLFIASAQGTNATSNTFNSAAIYFPNYTSANAKAYSSDSVAENNSSAASQFIYAGISSVTAAITTILFGDGGSGLGLATGSTASLYGILKGSGGATVS